MNCHQSPRFLRQFAGFSVFAIACVSAAAQTYTPYAITTIAGNSNGSGSGDGQGTAALFDNPKGIATDSQGNLYIADTVNDTIRILTPGSTASVATLAGSAQTIGHANGSPASATFNAPTDVAVDSAGTVYVADTGNEAIRMIKNGAVSTLTGQPGVIGHADGTLASATFAEPMAVALDSAGNLYVADTGAKTVRMINIGTGQVTTVAGQPGVIGHADGAALTVATFNGPEGLTVDSAGNIYVADTGNDTIRMISGGQVTTIAGQANVTGHADGTGVSALFNQPAGITVDAGGTLYVADTANDTIRRITPARTVTTLAGLPLTTGTQDGSGGVAMFYTPWGVAVDSSGNLFIADYWNNTIREGVSSVIAISVQPQSVVSVNGGTATFSVSASGPSLTYQWYFRGAAVSGATASSLTVNPVGSANTGAYYVVVAGTGGSVTSATVQLSITGDTSPTVTNPANQTVNAGGTAAFSVTGTGGDLSYQWYFNGQSIAGANSATLSLANVGTAQSGYYAAGVTNGAGSAISANALLTVNYSARLVNISARSGVASTTNILIGGFGISGTGTKNLLLRGVGPGLTSYFGLTGTLSNPQLTLFDSVPTAIVTNIGWGNGLTAGASTVSVSPQAATSGLMNTLGAFTILTGSADSAMEVTPAVGSYTAQVSGVGGTSGIALMEIYDADTGAPPARLVNLSARSAVGVGGNILIGGFAIAGSTPETVLIRGVGPGLSSYFGLAGYLVKPQLVLLDSIGAGNIIASNSGWGTAPATGPSTVHAGVIAATAAVMAEVGAFPVLSGSTDAAMVVTLPPGNYTAQLSGVGASSGIGLVEVYEVP